MSIASRAVKESKEVVDLAVAAAKKELIEEMLPSIRAMVESQLRAGTLGEDVDRLRRAEDGHGETEFEEGKEMKDKDKLESVAALFPGITEMADDDDAVDESTEEVDEGFEDMDETADAVDEEKDEMDEEIDLNNEELEAMYAESLKLEAEVKSGFSDMARPHELGAGAKAQYQSDPANLADYASGEKEWDEVEPPAKQKWTVENIRKLARQGLAENAQLARDNKKLRESCLKMLKKLKEQNLINSKILCVNKFITAHRLTAEQKQSVIESIDKGRTVKEVKNIYSIIESSFKASGGINESARRAPRANSQRARTTGAPDTRVLRESADRSEGRGVGRWQQLAGLKKLTNG